MELRKIRIAVWTVVGTVAGISVVMAAGPATAPALASAVSPATAPSTQPAMKAQASSSDNSNNSRQGRNNRRTRGNRDSSATPVILASDPYAVLDTRSIFIKGDQTTASNAPRSIGDNASGAIFPGRQASALVFNGVILINDEALAMVEDSNSGVVVKVHAGDLISGGRVTGITFGDLAYEANGQIKHVEIGQNLEGRVPSSSGYSGAPVAAPTSMPAGAPAGGAVASPPGSSTSGMSLTDIEAKLKARRAAESSGGK
jgi:hypothetical protein